MTPCPARDDEINSFVWRFRRTPGRIRYTGVRRRAGAVGYNIIITSRARGLAHKGVLFRFSHTETFSGLRVRITSFSGCLTTCTHVSIIRTTAAKSLHRHYVLSSLHRQRLFVDHSYGHCLHRNEQFNLADFLSYLAVAGYLRTDAKLS